MSGHEEGYPNWSAMSDYWFGGEEHIVPPPVKDIQPGGELTPTPELCVTKHESECPCGAKISISYSGETQSQEQVMLRWVDRWLDVHSSCKEGRGG